MFRSAHQVEEVKIEHNVFLMWLAPGVVDLLV